MSGSLRRRQMFFKGGEYIGRMSPYKTFFDQSAPGFSSGMLKPIKEQHREFEVENAKKFRVCVDITICIPRVICVDISCSDT